MDSLGIEGWLLVSEYLKSESSYDARFGKGIGCQICSGFLIIFSFTSLVSPENSVRACPGYLKLPPLPCLSNNRSIHLKVVISGT